MLFSFLYRNLKGYRLLVVLAIVVTVGQVGSDLLAAMPLKFIPSKINNPGSDPACTFPVLNPILDFFDQFDPTAPGQVKTPASFPCPGTDTNAIPQFTHHSVVGVIIFSVCLLIIFGILSALLVYVQLFLATFVAQHLTARLRSQLFEHLQRLSLDWHGKQKKGDLVQRVIGNIADIEKLVTDGLVDLLAGSLTLIGVAAIMIIISPPYTLLSLAIAPALFLIVLNYTKTIKAAAKKASKATGQVAEVATEDMNALTVIRAFTLEEREDLRFKKYVGKNRDAGLLAGGLQAQFTPLVSVLIVFGTAIVIGIGGYVASGNPFSIGFFRISAASVDIGTLVLFLTYLKMLYQPMRDLSKLTNLASSATSGAERIQEVLDQAPEVVEVSTPYNGPSRLKGEIIFDHVFFGYTKDRAVLQDINLRIPAGRKVALVGLSGGGKTTLVKLIPRFYEYQYGTVKIDGVDNRVYPLNILRQNVSMVLQDSVLFEGSIRENIEIGRPGASMEEIIDAAKKANIHDTIMTMLGGYDRMIREQGKDLSGGQRQRMAIARAILRDAPILILDEPTAALDVESEAEVMHALDKLVLGRTVLMISHRLSTLGNVDEIIVLKDGGIIEQGTYKDLKRKGGIFAHLLEEQNRYSVEKAGEKSILRSAFVHYPQDSIPASGPQLNQVNMVPPPIAGSQVPQGAPRSAVHPARVLIEIDGKVVSEYPLSKPVMTVGRLNGNDVPVPNQRVSRLHAKIRQEHGRWLIEDADSVNGLVYKGHRVDKLILKDGDRIHIAPSAVLQYKTVS